MLYRLSAVTGWPGVSTLQLDKVENCMCNFGISVAACQII